VANLELDGVSITAECDGGIIPTAEFPDSCEIPGWTGPVAPFFWEAKRVCYISTEGVAEGAVLSAQYDNLNADSVSIYLSTGENMVQHVTEGSQVRVEIFSPEY